MEKFSVAVVGGGPAGSAAAREAAKDEDKDVVVLEKGVPRADRQGMGPDSTDAAGTLDYWVELMDIPEEEFPKQFILREIDAAEFIGPSEKVTLRSTGLDSWYENFGFTFDRVKMDDWFRKKAEEEGAEYRTGVSVKDVETELGNGDTKHHLGVSDAEDIEADYLVLADGPQRQATIPVLEQFEPSKGRIREVLGPTKANHIAYQEYREFPEEIFEEDILKFWWGWMPGETAYPWFFPNDGNVAKVGLTRPMTMDIDEVGSRDDYKLLRDEDKKIPTGNVYIERLLEEVYGDEYDVEDFPLVEDRGKRGGTETYPISSTRPIESPIQANIAVTGGAMAATSAFHEGGQHLAVRTGKIAGRLISDDRIESYNDEWKKAIGDEILRNVTMASLVKDYEPSDWDNVFGKIAAMLDRKNRSVTELASAGVTGMKLKTKYKLAKRKFKNGKYVTIKESEYRT